MTDFKEIWLPLADRFYRVAYYLMESEEDAEDAVQELYLKLLTMSDRIMYVREPSAFGITLIKNICIDRIRRRQSIKTEQISEYIPSDNVGPDKSTADRDSLRRLIQEIEKLPDKQAKALKMRTLEGLEYEEISQRTGMSQVNIRVLISIARKTLKKNIEK